MPQLIIRVVLADDHPVIRLGVEDALDRLPTVKLLGSASQRSELMTLLCEHPVDVVVTDYAMPNDGESDGLEMLSEIRRTFPDVRIVVLTGLDEPSLIRRLIDQGISRVVSKGDDLHHVGAAVMAAFANRTYYSPLIAALQQQILLNASTITLSPREREIVVLLIQGLTVGEVGARLNLKKQTVSTHKTSAKRKLGVERDAELFRFKSDLGIADNLD